MPNGYKCSFNKYMTNMVKLIAETGKRCGNWISLNLPFKYVHNFRYKYVAKS